MSKSVYVADFTAASNVATGAAGSTLDISSATVTGSLTVKDWVGSAASIGSPAHITGPVLRIASATGGFPAAGEVVELVTPTPPKSFELILDIPVQTVNTDFQSILVKWNRATGTGIVLNQRIAVGGPAQNVMWAGSYGGLLLKTGAGSGVSTLNTKPQRMVIRCIENNAGTGFTMLWTALDMTGGTPAFQYSIASMDQTALTAIPGMACHQFNNNTGIGFARNTDTGFSRVELRSHDARWEAYPHSIAVSKTGVVVKLRGINTTAINGTTFAISNPVVSANDATSGTSITATTWTSATEVDLTLTTGATTGIIEITDNTGLTASCYLTLAAAAAQPTPNLVLTDQADDGTVTLDVTGLSLGNSISPLSYQLHDGHAPNFTPSSATAIAGKTKPPFNYLPTFSDGLPHYLKLVVSDSTGTPIVKTTPSLRVLPRTGPTAAVLAVGDSTTAGLSDFIGPQLRAELGNRRVWVGNHSLTGLQLAQYLPTYDGSASRVGYSTSYNYFSVLVSQVQAWEADPSIVTIVVPITLGINDANFAGTTPVALATQMTTLLTSALAATSRAIFLVNDPAPTCQPAPVSAFGEGTQNLAVQYAAAYDAIVATMASNRVKRGARWYGGGGLLGQFLYPPAALQPNGLVTSIAGTNTISDGSGPHFAGVTTSSINGYPFFAGVIAQRVAQVLGDVNTGSRGRS